MKTVDKYQFNEELARVDHGRTFLPTQFNLFLLFTLCLRSTSLSEESASTERPNKILTIHSSNRVHFHLP